MSVLPRQAPEAMPASPAATPASTGTPRRRWLRGLLLCGLILGVLSLVHAPLLQAVGQGLVVASSPGPAPVLVVSGRTTPYVTIPVQEVVTLLQQDKKRTILLIEDRSSRLVESNILPTLESLYQKELTGQGISLDRITTLAGEYRTPWETARALKAWLEEHPETRVTLLCEELSTREASWQLASVLDPGQRSRVGFSPIRDIRHDPTNWWRSRQGILGVCGGYVSLGHLLLFGEPPVGERWDPDVYEQQLRDLPR